MKNENFLKLNSQQICTVKSFINCVCPYYSYKQASGILFWKIKEGFYWTLTLGGPEYCSTESIESEGDFIIKGQQVFYKPQLEIRMSNGQMIKKRFETETELFDFMKSKEMEGVNWINQC